VFRGASRLARARALVASAPTRGMAGPSGAGKGDRRGGFWSKWNAATQQEFAQEVAFEGDKRSERRRSPLRSVAQAAAQDPRDDYDDLEFLLDDSLESVGEAIGGEGRDGGRGQAAEELEAVREALLSDDAVSARRRAELLGLLDELGPAALAAPARYPPPGSEGRREALDLDELGLDDDGGSGDLSMVSSFLDSVRLREAGALPPGGFFAHVLHTRAVSKVTSGGKKRSISVLAVVGNGAGSAGFGLGKDEEATEALVKACKAARKQLLHVDRFDGRTIFHDMEDTWARTKCVVLMRRAGSGTRCSWLMWKILNAFGITDVSVKVHGSKNKINQTRCIFNALQRMVSARDVANNRGKRVLDMTPRSSIAQAGYRPD